MAAGRPILVTGSHRSGTTWCGRLISEASDAYYIHEPFNLYHPLGICPITFDRWFQHIDEHNASQYVDALSHPANLRFALGAQLRASLQWKRQNTGTGFRGALWGMRKHYQWRRVRQAGARPLIKDPIALFSAEWIARRFDAQVVVTIRHPAAFVHSIRRAGWGYDFTNFAEQPALIDSLLSPYADEIREAAEAPGDLVDQGILIWRLTHHVISIYREEHPDWIFVRNEDLATHPFGTYSSIFASLGLSFGESQCEVVRAFTKADSANKEEEGSLYSVRRDSQYEAWKWKNELDSEVIRRVREETQSVWSHFYDGSEWT